MEEIISIKHFWDAVSSISFIMLTIFLARIARKQNIIQENALKLEMYDKYYQIINALEADIEYYNSLKSAIVLSLKGNPNVAKMYFKFNREIDKILPLAKQLLTKGDF